VWLLSARLFTSGDIGFNCIPGQGGDRTMLFIGQRPESVVLLPLDGCEKDNRIFKVLFGHLLNLPPYWFTVNDSPGVRI